MKLTRRTLLGVFGAAVMRTHAPSSFNVPSAGEFDGMVLSRKLSPIEICKLFNVPPEMVFGIDQAKYFAEAAQPTLRKPV